ncbi:acetyl-CoA carboxylase biotin carboxylase subunit [Heliobacterium gestii]|uniref:biotin carboxylase n=1 Tax=Heliomicrobium gestii TaxID=2699 RepID=A0A845LBD2_HELGE|nr:acetyl-CoA carboxylase biotin carboxylase subunit [Heliomicrobium gestii]MBM7867704.1 acetyl-CoA carboxylase biotin carboxylase subunit [Heliomicrobium gestii]MZP44097.1 acetyl-CoA carboxylase biotin carboxylase subunit [Heliomicrobium gestii]
MFKKLLVANRGEIALRVIKAAHGLGIKTAAIYSDADADSLHVKEAGEAFRLGPPPVAQSYLMEKKIIETALACGADAIHPGYGLLSENDTFAQQCVDAGLIFIGPSPALIRDMGNKVQARHIMANLGVPVAPGTVEPVTEFKVVRRIAESVGYPVIVKAAAGGGGIGMQIAKNETELAKAWDACANRAARYFGNGTVFIEKYFNACRHVEIQLLADQHGNTIHLGERECSIQRRNQKVLEEAPAPRLSQEVIERMGKAAVHAAKALGYVNAGTMEFLVDEGGRFYFLEMNTRLQVEHPVTEMVTGVDIVQEQIRIAAGEPLAWTQDAIGPNGHAIEFRLYAENPLSFAPSPGVITEFRFPDEPGVRVDTWVTTGSRITPYYDPLIAKVIVHGESRQDALERWKAMLPGIVIEGIQTNLPLLQELLVHEEFLAGRVTTRFLQERLGRKQ